MTSSEIKTTLLTGRQANVMDHALAFPKLNRNGFEATDGLANDDTWKELVALGYAAKVEGFSVPGKTRYEVTESGIKTLQAFHEGKAKEPEAATPPNPL
ncbi:hypothetical protein [Rhizobium sp. MHM7A]|uniref:hypothetical protein n=1 Tax=Rhizobium sp. MHM7A TaxID=2583233 RepID=UPI0011062186|nr:hypothetical protein [Rhizobium sp. MHM7A]TLX16395.1 hypothetical protein FFR93_03415 [Rhizobium sp. MHM7A]